MVPCSFRDRLCLASWTWLTLAVERMDVDRWISTRRCVEPKERGSAGSILKRSLIQIKLGYFERVPGGTLLKNSGSAKQSSASAWPQ